MIQASLLSIFNVFFVKRAYQLFLLISLGFVHSVAQAAPPTFSIAFSPSTIAPGAVSTLTYTIDNSTGSAITDVTFTNDFPTGMTITPEVNLSNTCGGQVTAVANTGTLSFYLDRMGAGASCALSVDVTSSTGGTHSNTTSDLTSSAGNSGSANASLTVDTSRPSFSIALSPSTIAPNAISTLTYTIDNSLNGSNASFLRFTTSLPSGVVVSPQPNISSTCTNPMLTAASNSDSIQLTFVNLSAGASCTIDVDITANNVGTYLINSGELSQNGSNPSGADTTSLSVELSTVNISFPASVVPGSTATLTYQIVNNNRGQDMTDLTFSNDLNAALSGLSATALPSSGFCGSGSTITGSSNITISGANLVEGESCSFDITVLIPANAAAGDYTNTTSTISYNLNGSPATSPASSNTISVYNAPLLSMAFVEDVVALGNDATFRFTVTNTDSNNALSGLGFNVRLNGSVVDFSNVKTLTAANSCGSGSTFSTAPEGGNPSNPTVFVMNNGNLAKGANCTFDLVITVPENSLPGAYSFSTTAIVGTIAGQAIAGNAASDTISVIGAPALTLSLSPNVVLPGDTVTASFTLNYTQNALSDAEGIGFTLDLDGALSGLVSTSGPETNICGTGSSISGSDLLTFTGGTMSPGDTCSFSVSLQIPSNAASGNVTLTSSEVSATTSSRAVTSAAASQSVLLSGLSFTKSFLTNPVLPGSATVVRYTIANSANAGAATDIQFSDNFSTVISGLSASSMPTTPCNGSSVAIGTSLLSFAGGELQPGTSCSFDVPLNVPANAAEGIYGSTTSALSATVASSAVVGSSAYAALTVEELTVQLTSSASNPTSISPIPVAINFSREIAGLTSDDLSVTNGSVTSLSGSGLTYAAEITPSGDGDVSVQLPADAVTDAVDNTVLNPASNTLTVTYQSVPDVEDPSILISSPSAASTASGSITYSITYSNVTQVNLIESAITLNKTGTANADVTITNGDTTSPTVTLSNVTGDGALGISIASGSARNSSKTAGAAGPSSTFSVDNTQPTVAITSSLSGSEFNDASFTATFTFSEDVSGFDISDIVASNANLSNFNATSAKVYTVTVEPEDDGVVTLDVAAGKAADSVGNSNTGATQFSVTYDTVSPTVTITSDIVGSATNQAFIATFTFNEEVSGFELADINATNADITNFVSSSADVYTATVTPDAEGAVIINVASNIAEDVAGNGNAQATEFSTSYDITSPTVSISSNVVGQTTNSSFVATFTFNEGVTGFTIDDINASNADVSQFVATSSSVYSVTVTPTNDGTVTLDVLANAAQDDAENGNTAASQFSLTYDGTVPTLAVSSAVTNGLTNGAFTATFTFSEEVSGFALADINLSNANASNFASTNDALYTALITPESDGAVTINVASDVAQDVAGNGNAAASQISTTFDGTQPSVTISSNISGDKTNSDFTATFTFSEAVTGFVLSDIVASNAQVSEFVAVSTSVYTATITPTIDGAVTLDVNASAAKDTAGNDNTAAVQFLTSYDATAPTVAISSNVSGSITNSAFVATFTFSEAVTSFEASDVIINNGVLSNFSSTSTSVYTGTITPNSDGTVYVDINANVAQDDAANNNAAATQFSITYDATLPRLTISGPTSTVSAEFLATFTFSESVSGFALGDINVGNGVASNFSSTSSSTYTATITPTNDGLVTVDVGATAAQDNAGNNNSAAIQYTVAYDATAPTVIISGPSTNVNSAFEASFTFSEGVNGFSIADIQASNASLSDFSVSSASEYTVLVTPFNEGTVTLNVAANIAQDDAGNGNNAASSYSTTYDATAPNVTITGPASPVNATFTTTFTFNESISGFSLGDIAVGNATVSDLLSISSTVFSVRVTPFNDGPVTLDLGAGAVQDNAGNTNTAAAQFTVDYDGLSPAVQISSDVVGNVTNKAFTATFTFNESVTGFTANDVTLDNASISGFSIVSESVYTAIISPINNGEVTINVDEDVAQDLAGNDNSASSFFTLTYDITPPLPTISSNLTGAFTNGAFEVTVSFNKPVSGFVASDIVTTNASLGNIQVVNNLTYKVAVTPINDGEVTVNVPSGVAEDRAGNGNSAATQYAVTFDSTSPTLSITSDVTGDTTNESFTATFTYSEDVTGFSASGVVVTNGTLSNFVSTSASVYTALITPSSDGEVAVNVGADAAQDSAGNGNSAATQYAVTFDGTAPTVAITTDITGDTINDAFTATFTFSEDVTGFSGSGVAVTNGTLSNFLATSAAVYTATVTPSSDGEVTINVVSDVAQDSAGNGNSAATQYAVAFNGTAPTVAITSDITGDTTNEAFTATFTFSEDVTGFLASGVVVTNGTLSNFLATNASVYTALITPSSDGEVAVNVGADVAQDSAGNGNSAATQYAVTFNSTAPAVSITVDITGDTTNEAFTATFTFSEDVTGFSASGVAVTNGALSNFVSTSASVYTALITPSSDGEVTIKVNANGATDSAGNGNTASELFTIGYDGTSPILVSTSPENNAVDIDNARLQVSLVFNEAITVGAGNIVLTNIIDNSVIETLSLSGASVTVSSDTITAAFASTLAQNETYGISIASDVIFDVAGNAWQGFADGEFTFTASNQAPNSNDDSVSTDEDTEVVIAVLDNDDNLSEDVDLSTLNIELSPLNGTTQVDTTTGQITYTPNANYNGIDSFTYVISDRQGVSSEPATVTVTVNPINDAPQAVNDSVSTSEEQLLIISVLDNDVDVDESSNVEPNTIVPTSVVIVGTASNGDLTVVSEDMLGQDSTLKVGQVIYTPDVNFFGTDEFSYSVSDSLGANSNVATVTITVGAENDSPIATDDTTTTNEDTNVVIDVTANDSDTEDQLDINSVVIERQGTLGTASVDSNTGLVTYAPTNDQFGTDTFEYSVKDFDGLKSNVATVTVNIISVNDAPIAQNDSYSLEAREPTVLRILTNDTDPDTIYEPNNIIDVTSVTLIAAPALGMAEVNTITGEIVYTPNDDVTEGTDSLTYQVSDTSGEPSNIATVQISLQLQSVNVVANDDSAQTSEDTSVVVNILANDGDETRTLDPASVSISANPQNGEVQLNSDGTVNYTPFPNFFGQDLFTYTVRDIEGELSNVATVTITIAAVNDAPVISGNPSTSIVAGNTYQFIPSVSDVDSNAFTYAIENKPSWSSFNATTGQLTGATAQSDAGVYSNIIITVFDNGGASATLPAFSIEVISTSALTPTASAMGIQVLEDDVVNFQLMATDPNGLPLTYQIAQQPQSGSLSGSLPSLIYTPNANFNGTDSLTFTASNGDYTSEPAVVTISVEAVNDAPVISGAPTASVIAGNAYQFVPSVSDIDSTEFIYSVANKPSWASFNTRTGLLSGTPGENDARLYSNIVISVSDDAGASVSLPAFSIDVVSVASLTPTAQSMSVDVEEDSSTSIQLVGTDPNNQPLTYQLVQQPQFGSLTGTPPAVTYTPNENYNGVDSFTFTASNGEYTSAPASVNITVTAVNDAPEISGTPDVSVIEGNAYSFTPSVTDIDSDSFVFGISNQPSWTTFSTSTGQLTGTPSESDVGNYENIVITVTDNADGEASLAAFSIEVIGKSQFTPTAQARDVSLNEDSSVSFVLTATDPNDLPLTYQLLQQPQSGVITGVIPSVTYTPNENYTGTDSFTFVVTNGEYTSEPAQVNIDVIAVNDAPEAVDDEAEVVEGQTISIDVLANDTDVDVGDALIITRVQAEQGVANIVDNALSYQADANFIGTVIVDYTISDTDGLAASAQVVIEVIADTNRESNITLEAPDDVEVNATGLVTRVQLGQAVAFDNFDNPVSTSLQGTPFFKPGKHTVVWRAESGDEVQQRSQRVTVYPLVSVIPAQRVEEGRTVKVDVFLNGPAPEYPLNIPYTVSGTSDSDDHNLNDGVLVIENGTQASLLIDIEQDGVDEGDETLIITLDSSNNTNNGVHTITIVEAGVVPRVQLAATQNNTFVTTIYPQEGVVEINLSLLNKALDDIATVDWSESSIQLNALNISGSDTAFIFSPETLSTGIYHVKAHVTDMNGLTGFADLTLKLSEQPPQLTGIDSDNDGIPDDEEGYGDSDGDGIPDYLDAANECNIQPVIGADTNNFLVEGESGACFRLGEIAMSSSDTIALDDNNIPPDTETTNIGTVIDFVVNGLSEVGQSYRVVIPLHNIIPEGAIYRKYDSQLEAWKDFDASGLADALQSAKGEQGICPPPGDSSYVEGLTAGHWCLQLTISDGGPNDDDGVANGVIVDPSGLVVLASDNQRPIANDDVLRLDADSAVALNVLDNDTDADGDTLMVISADAYLGHAEISNSELLYTPPENFVGIDTLVYAISDGNGGTASALAQLTVNVNNAPEAQDDTAQTDNQTAVVIDVLANDSDADGDALTIISADVDSGSVTISDNKLTFTPELGFTGIATINYQVEDDKGARASAIVVVTVTSRVNQAPEAQDDTATTNNESSITVNVLANDSDPDGDELTLVSVDASVGSVSIENNQVVYVPQNTFVGSAVVTYVVTDGEFEASATLTIDVTSNATTPGPKKSSGGSFPTVLLLMLCMTLIYRLYVKNHIVFAKNYDNAK